jgi:hypothetical protein
MTRRQEKLESPSFITRLFHLCIQMYKASVPLNSAILCSTYLCFSSSLRNKLLLFVGRQIGGICVPVNRWGNDDSDALYLNVMLPALRKNYGERHHLSI